MRRLGFALSLLIAVAFLPDAAWAWGHHAHGGFHGRFQSNAVVIFVGPQRPFVHHPHFVRPFAGPVFAPAPVVVGPAPSPVWVPDCWQWTGWQWVWVPGRWVWAGW